jgi:hypothetical protein
VFTKPQTPGSQGVAPDQLWFEVDTLVVFKFYLGMHQAGSDKGIYDVAAGSPIESVELLEDW